MHKRIRVHYTGWEGIISSVCMDVVRCTICENGKRLKMDLTGIPLGFGEVMMGEVSMHFYTKKQGLSDRTMRVRNLDWKMALLDGKEVMRTDFQILEDSWIETPKKRGMRLFSFVRVK